jgi:DNA-binding LytR/AlgR family response regulator
MKVLIADDEAPARRRLSRQLAAIADVEVAGEAGDGLEALQKVRALDPDLLLLDVGMPELDGISLAAQHGDDLPPIIFTTAHDRFAVKAFELNAVDYLLKPIPQERLLAAVERARRRAEYDGGAAPALEDRARAAAALAARGGPSSVPRVILSERGTIRFFDAREVTRFFALDKYTVFLLGGHEHLIQESLSTLEERLAPHGFLRVHRAELVNLLKVRALHTADGLYELEFSDGQRARVSRRYLPAMKEVLGI